VRVETDTVRLTQAQTVELFERDKSAIPTPRAFAASLYHQTAGNARAFAGNKTKFSISTQIEEFRQQIENLVVTNEQYSELYHALIELTSQKKLAEEKPRRRIGFKTNNE
jgi:hypothetical protein